MAELNDKHKKQNPFKVPEGYFEKLDARIIENVGHSEKKEKVKIIPIVKSFMWLAASFIFIISIGRLVVPYFSNPDEKLSGTTIASRTTNTNVETTFDFTEDFNPTAEEIIDYLEEEGIDGELLYAELQ